uniref:Uncharacterized protein n=1 Tax=Kalanchoe fedtschenkoi TaxID=63787 RepID=A0A7N0ZZT0_KALFE
MGVCPSSPNLVKRSTTTLNGIKRRTQFSPPPTAIKMVNTKNGKLHLRDDPNLTAQNIVSQFGGGSSDRCFLSDSESLCIGLPPPEVQLHEQLRPGGIYFLFPKSRAGSRISLAELAIVASGCFSCYSSSRVDR